MGQFGPSCGRIRSMLLFHIFFRTSFKFVVTIMVGHQKDNVFCVNCVALLAAGWPPGPNFFLILPLTAAKF